MSATDARPIEREMTSTLIRRIGKGYCAAGEGFYVFDEDLSRVLQRVAEFTRRFDSEGRESEPETAEPRLEATPKA